MKRTALLVIIDFSTSDQFAATILFTFSQRLMPHATLHVAALKDSRRRNPLTRCEVMVFPHLDVRPRSQPMLIDGQNSPPAKGGWK
jgi:hypothetical protein